MGEAVAGQWCCKASHPCSGALQDRRAWVLVVHKLAWPLLINRNQSAVNDVVAVSFRQMHWRESATQLIEHVFMQTFFGGSSLR